MQTTKKKKRKKKKKNLLSCELVAHFSLFVNRVKLLFVKFGSLGIFFFWTAFGRELFFFFSSFALLPYSLLALVISKCIEKKKKRKALVFFVSFFRLEKKPDACELCSFCEFVFFFMCVCVE